MLDHKSETSWWLLKLTFGIIPIAAGLDKFFNLLTHWPDYVSPMGASLLPFSTQTFMYLVGVIEMVAGLIVLSRWTRVGAYIVSAWLVCIALNLLTTGQYFDVAVRDIAMAVSAFCLARLSEAREQATAPSTQPAKARPVAAHA